MKGCKNVEGPISLSTDRQIETYSLQGPKEISAVVIFEPKRSIRNENVNMYEMGNYFTSQLEDFMTHCWHVVVHDA